MVIEWLQKYQLLVTVVVGALAWLTGKAWELQQTRGRRYADIAGLLAAVVAGRDPAARTRLDTELAKPWVDAPTNVTRAAERVRLSLDRPGDRDEPIRTLVITMRRDTALWSWFAPARRHRLQADEIELDPGR